MFDIDQLENKAMTHKTIYVKNNGNAMINDLAPGRSMPLRANHRGLPIDPRWRRLTRRRSSRAVLQLSDNDPSKEDTKTAKAKKSAKAKSKPTKKGDQL